jgi:hypothetical protein
MGQQKTEDERTHNAMGQSRKSVKYLSWPYCSPVTDLWSIHRVCLKSILIRATVEYGDFLASERMAPVAAVCTKCARTKLQSDLQMLSTVVFEIA